MATKPLPPWASPALQSGGQNSNGPSHCHMGGFREEGQNHKWSTNGPAGYMPPLAWGVSSTSGRGIKLVVVHKCAGMLRDPCPKGGSQRFRAGDKISNGPQAGHVAT